MPVDGTSRTPQDVKEWKKRSHSYQVRVFHSASNQPRKHPPLDILRGKSESPPLLDGKYGPTQLDPKKELEIPVVDGIPRQRKRSTPVSQKCRQHGIHARKWFLNVAPNHRRGTDLRRWHEMVRTQPAVHGRIGPSSESVGERLACRHQGFGC